MADIVERLVEHADQAHESGSLGWRDTMNEAADEITRLRALNAELVEALKQITDLTERPADLFPADWKEQIAACPECQRYKDHPIQRGICDTHRKPIYANEAHNAHETRILGYRAKDIARAAIAKAERKGA